MGDVAPPRLPEGRVIQWPHKPSKRSRLATEVALQRAVLAAITGRMGKWARYSGRRAEARYVAVAKYLALCRESTARLKGTT